MGNSVAKPGLLELFAAASCCTRTCLRCCGTCVTRESSHRMLRRLFKLVFGFKGLGLVLSNVCSPAGQTLLFITVVEREALMLP